MENPCGTQSFLHWQTAFNTAVIQIVSSQFSSQRRITREGRDLYSTASTKFLPDDTSTANTTTAHGLQICQPLLLNHMYYCRNKTILDLQAFCETNRSDIHTS